eukprot:1280690-Pyramimonas_sp.AAC.1
MAKSRARHRSNASTIPRLSPRYNLRTWALGRARAPRCSMVTAARASNRATRSAALQRPRR